MTRRSVASATVLGFMATFITGYSSLRADDCNYLSLTKEKCPDSDLNFKGGDKAYACTGRAKGDCDYSKDTHDTPKDCQYLDGTSNCTTSTV